MSALATARTGDMRVGRTTTVLVLAIAVACLVLLAGFIAFASSATRQTSLAPPHTDGIVVLTGGSERRIEEGMRLLEQGIGRRLLISGINPKTSPQDLRRLAHATGHQFDCCIDYGYSAQNTVGNAEETRAWARQHGFSRLTVVTASHHMPRGLTELSRVLPHTELVPYPVVPRQFRDEIWWLNLSSTRMLFSEYIKLIPAAMRLAAARLLATHQPEHIIPAINEVGIPTTARTLVGRAAP